MCMAGCGRTIRVAVEPVLRVCDAGVDGVVPPSPVDEPQHGHSISDSNGPAGLAKLRKEMGKWDTHGIRYAA